MRLYVLTVHIEEDRRSNPFGGIYKSMEEAKKAALIELDNLHDLDDVLSYPMAGNPDWTDSECSRESQKYGPWAYSYNEKYDVHFHISGQKIEL